MLSTGALLSTPPSVAVIGGGVAGLACARKLQELGLSRTVVYDTGKHAVGGRASSRTWRGQPADHAAQFVAATTPEFGAYMEGLETAGVARRLAPGELGHVRAPGAATPLDDDIPRYSGVGGMGERPGQGRRLRQKGQGIKKERGMLGRGVEGKASGRRRRQAALIPDQVALF